MCVGSESGVGVEERGLCVYISEPFDYFSQMSLCLVCSSLSKFQGPSLGSIN